MNYSPTANKWNLLLVILFCLVQAGLVIAFGVYTKEEATKYIYEADFFLQQGQFSQPKYIFYSLYIFLQILAFKLHAGFIGVYIFQLLLNGLATVCFYKLALKVSGDKKAAFISTALLILCIPFQKWTAYLFTESIFFSLVIIFTYVLFTQYKNANTRPLLLLLLLFLLIISRPTGMLLIPASLILASHYLWANGKKWLMLAVWLPGIAGLILLLDTAIKGKGEFDFIKPFVEEHIICGLAGRPDAGPHDYSNSLGG
ncbi:MAG TPA: glycosyltransferase family 39 protein, partial [Chitinophagaceae bacterium]